MIDIWLPLAGGLVLLIAGGDLLVRGAVRVAERLGVSPLVIGLTLVGFGTSTPELVTSVQAALAGAPGIAWGNIVGSNIANILLIAGVSALVFPIIVAAPALKRDAGVMLAVAALFTALAAFVPMSRGLGAAFLLALAAYTALAFRQERASDGGALHDKQTALAALDPALAPGPARRGALLVPLLLTLGGLALVIGGGAALVRGAVALAQSFAIPETVIGLTIVAIGTSMPELVTSVMAALRRQGDVAFGNIVGSNIINILGIGGITALIAPTPVPAAIAGFDAPVMLAVTVLLVVVAATGLRIARSEGALLLAGYALYLAVIWP
ncbi:cation:H+ antiporter [Roseovarius sp. MBR-78]|jgi:cation:H+ antiporter|uniref:calcium/sodium antiporter n=1 Tax=Roseovarius sp. MBR-78 TaxID=3156460 RepID=UPI0033940962